MEASFLRQPSRVHLLLSTFFITGVAYTVGIELYGPFLRSLVTCVAPPGQTEGLGNEFSGSARCADTAHVLTEAQAQEGALVSTKLVVHGLAAPLLGAIADTRGRKPVLLFGLLGFALAFALLSVLGASGSSNFSALMACFLVEGATNAFDVVYIAMLADLCPCPGARSSAFTAMQVYNTASFAAGQAVAVAVLRLQLVEYTYVWAVLSAVCVCNALFVFAAVEETMPRVPGAVKLSAPSATDTLRRALTAPLSAMTSDGFLRLWLVGEAISTLGGAGLRGIMAAFTISAYGWRPGDLQMYTTLCKPVELVSLLAPGLLGWRLRPARCAVASLLADQALAACRLLSPFAPGFLLSAAYGESAVRFLAPASTAFFSAQFPQERQATVSALRHLCSNVATAASHLVVSSPLLFNPAASGWHAAPPFAAALLFGIAGCVVKLRAIERNAAASYAPLPVKDSDGEGLAAHTIGRPEADGVELDDVCARRNHADGHQFDEPCSKRSHAAHAVFS